MMLSTCSFFRTGLHVRGSHCMQKCSCPDQSWPVERAGECIHWETTVWIDVSLKTKSTVAFQEDGSRVTAAKMSAKLEFIFIDEICICHEYFSCRTWHCLYMQSVVVAQQMNARAWVKAPLICSSAEWDHDGSVFLFPVAGVWSNRELYAAVAELLALCSQVQWDQGLAALLALHWPLSTQQVTAQTRPEIHRDTSERNTGPGVPSEDSDSNEVNNLPCNQLKVFKYQ